RGAVAGGASPGGVLHDRDPHLWLAAAQRGADGIVLPAFSARAGLALWGALRAERGVYALHALPRRAGAGRTGSGGFAAVARNASPEGRAGGELARCAGSVCAMAGGDAGAAGCVSNGRNQSEEHTSELQSREKLVCRL